ncbi:MAG: rod shape-determining protein MreC [Actinobacteria bacterium]|nr:rod shape-determining protein MreC [Actinomycetota bacterium]
MFSSLSRRRVILLVVLSCLLLITLDKRGNPVIDRLRGAFATLVMRPVDTATEAVVLPLERAWNGIVNYDEMKRDRDNLYDQVQHMKGNDVEAQTAILEARELFAITGLAAQLDFQSVVGQVVGESASNFQNTVEINVGSRRGVKVGMPVTDGAGIIGRITKVFPDQSIVLLAWDPSYGVSAQILATPEEVAEEISTRVTTPSGAFEDEVGTTTSTTIDTRPFDPPDPARTTTTTTPASTTTTTTTAPQIIRETGAIEGQGSDQPLIMRFTDSSSAVTTVRVGSLVDTAGGNSSLAPQGIPIGTVTRVVTETGSSNAVVEVTLHANLRRLNFVAVVLYEPNPEAIGR